jgi:hypothetical protein
MSSDTAALWADAMIYLEIHGEDWQDRAGTHAKLLASRRDYKGIRRWQQIIGLLTEIHQQGTQH